MDLKSKIRVIEDFPVEGISYKDITTLTKDSEALKEAVDRMAKNLEGLEVDYILGPEARGFIFATGVAYKMGVGFIPLRKPGKLPAEVISEEYDLEYGTNKLELHKDSIKKGDRVAIIDDLLATGGTVKSAASMVEKLGGEVVRMEFLIELTSLDARKLLKDYDVSSLVQYEI